MPDQVYYILRDFGLWVESHMVAKILEFIFVLFSFFYYNLLLIDSQLIID